MDNKIAVITGASSGIGLAVAELFAKKGYYVYALSRRAEDGKRSGFRDSIEQRCCDVTDEESIRKAFDNICRIDVMIHIAGFGIAGSGEMVSNEDAHLQMETNYFGVLNVNRMALPVMRARHSGTVLITGSVAGIYPIAFQGHYSASKFALEAYAGALRLELKGSGVKVSLIEPGDVKTAFTFSRRIVEPTDSPYTDMCSRSIAKMAFDEQHGLSTEAVAKLYYKVACKSNPAPSYATGFSYKFLVFIKRLFPNRFASWVLSKMYLPNK